MKNATTTDKKAKRPYVKKTLRTQDELWKSIITTLWSPFLRFCLEDWADKIDFTRKPFFLDKELRRIALRSKSKNRTVDVLMRIYLTDGTHKVFLLHIEVQGYFDPDFEPRLFQYYYRITDLLQEPIETLIIMIDDDPDWRPNVYRQQCGETEVYFKCKMFKLLDNPPPYTAKQDNPFSVVFEVAWHGLKQNMLKNDDDLMTLKFRLMRRLLENDTDVATIYDILEFINIYLPFKKPEKTTTFDRKIESIIDKSKDMGARTIRELYEEFLKENAMKIANKKVKEQFREERKINNQKIKKLEARNQEMEARNQEAKARQKEEADRRLEEEADRRLEEERLRLEAETRMTTLVRKLYEQGISAEIIADSMMQPLAFVQEMIGQSTPSV